MEIACHVAHASMCRDSSQSTFLQSNQLATHAQSLSELRSARAVRAAVRAPRGLPAGHAAARGGAGRARVAGGADVVGPRAHPCRVTTVLCAAARGEATGLSAACTTDAAPVATGCPTGRASTCHHSHTPRLCGAPRVQPPSGPPRACCCLSAVGTIRCCGWWWSVVRGAEARGGPRARRCRGCANAAGTGGAADTLPAAPPRSQGARATA